MADTKRAKKYATWLIQNKDQKGSDKWNKIQEAYLEAKPSTTLNKIGSVGRGLNVGFFSDIAGAPVDLMNQAPRLLNLLPGEQGFKPFSENPFMGSQNIRNMMKDYLDLGYKDIKDLPKGERPFAVGGEVVGQTLGTVLPLFGAASKVKAVDAVNKAAPKGNVLSQTIDDLVKTTAKNPVGTAAIEAGMTVGPAVGAGIAEQVSPGDPTKRLYGELAGAFSPLAITSVLPSLTKKLVSAVQTRLPGGVERQAANLLQREVIEGGGNPLNLAKTLKNADTSGTSGQVTNNQQLLAIENSIIADGGQFSSDIAAQTKATIDEFNTAYRQAISSGDPDLVRQAAEARKQYILTSLRDRATKAEQRALEIANTNLPNVDIDAVNRNARDILDKELRTARTTEDQLWTAVNRKLTVPATNFLKTYNEIKASLTVGESLPEPVVALANSLKKVRKKQKLGKGETTSNDLLRARSRYLERAREARADNKFGEARTYQTLADSMLKDLDPVVGEPAKLARDFSRTLNEKFTQGFVGKMLGFDRTGAPSTAAERTIEVAKSGSDVQQNLNVLAMQRAAGEASPEMLKQQQDFFTALASRTTEFDGSVNPNKLESFIQSNQQTLKSLGLDNLLTDISAQRRLADRISEQARKGSAFVNQKSTAAKVLGVNNINQTIKATLRSSNMAGDFLNLSRLAKRSKDPAVMEGLRYGVYETLLDAAKTNNDLISGNRLEQLLNVKSGGETLKQTLMKTNILTSSNARNIDRLIAKTKQFEAALANTGKIDDLLGGEDIFFDLLLRIGGANIGSQSALGSATGTPLVAAQAGSRASRSLFDKVPKLKVKNIIAEAVKNPKLMATLLEKPTTVSAKASRNARLNAVLLQAGIFDGSEILEEERN